jgi:competence protein ComEC
MHVFWKQSPFVKLLPAFISGILLFFIVETSNWQIPLLASIVLLAIYFLLQYQTDFVKLKYKFIQGLVINLLLVSIGFLICTLYANPTSKNWYKHHSKEYEYAVVKLTSDLEEKAKTYKAEIEVVSLKNDIKSISTQGKAFIYLKKDDTKPTLQLGDFILIKNKFQEIKPSGNPGSFDYAAYCHTKNIYESAFLQSNDYRTLSFHEKTLNYYFNEGNKYTRDVLQKYIKDSISLGIAEALLIGYRKDIDQEVWQAYSNTGIVHIIAISGLHMAMVYTSFKWILLLIPIFKKNRKIAIILALLFMWIFAAVTGMSPSVARAAVMFTFIGIGEISSRKIPVYNNLAASAFLLLCINPFWLKDVGFQLSYLAVFSLVLFYTPIYNWFYISNKYANGIWKLLSGTIAAQILTFPLCIYYFHQFPLLFMITNLIAVPLSSLILYLEISLIFTNFISPLAKFLGYIIDHIIQFLNYLVFSFSQLSFAVWQGINITAIQMITLYVVVVLLSFWLFGMSKKYFVAALATLCCFVAMLSFQEWEILHQKKLVVFNIAKESHLQFINGKNNYLANGEIDSSDSKQSLYVFKPAENYFHLTDTNSSSITTYSNNSISLFSFQGKKIAFLSGNNFQCEKPLEVDYLVIGKGCEISCNFLQTNFIAKQIIIDSSIPFWKIEKYKNELATLSYPFHIVNEAGAFVTDL